MAAKPTGHHLRVASNCARNASDCTPLLRGTKIVCTPGAEASLSVNPTQETQPLSNSPSASQSDTRHVAPDLLRGILMLLMALDHSGVSLGAYAHGTGIHSENATVPVTQWNPPVPYALRTAAHLVAPGFSMLMGMGIAYFVESRTRQGWSDGRLLTHVGIRGLAIVIVNGLSVQLLQFITARKAWLVNAVLLALAVDYLIVGGCYVLWLRYAEPELVKRWYDTDGSGVNASDYATSNGDRSAPESLEQNPHCCSGSSTLIWAAKKKSISWVVSAVLVLLSAVALWTNVWTSPSHGVCASSSTETSLSSSGDRDVSTLGAALGAKRMVAAAESPSSLCSSPFRVALEFFVRPVTCSAAGVWSGFPPLGWISFVLFGVAYGRILIALRGRKLFAQMINPLLAVVLAVAFVSTRLLDWGNLSSHCLSTPDQRRFGAPRNQYMASVRSFLYVVKYPPSPAFAFATLSCNFALLAVLDVVLTHSSSSAKAKLQSSRNPLLAYGAQPLFFYLAHLWILFFIRLVLEVSGALESLTDATGAVRVGLSPLFFSSYVALLAIMYPVSLWYGRWKKRQEPISLWRFL